MPLKLVQVKCAAGRALLLGFLVALALAIVLVVGLAFIGAPSAARWRIVAGDQPI